MVVTLGCTLLLISNCAWSDETELLTISTAEYRTQFLLELAYYFYFSAELMILFMILIAKRLFQEKPFPAGLHLTAEEKKRGKRWGLLTVAIGTLMLARHLLIQPLPGALAKIALDNPETLVTTVHTAYAVRAHLHLWVFFFFLNGWVFLESMIVYNGYKTYRIMRERLANG